MEISAAITRKGQVTIPAELRRALGLQPGDRIVLRILGTPGCLQPEGSTENRAPMSQAGEIPDFLTLAGTVPVPTGVDPNNWPAQRAAAWRAARGRDA